MTARSSEPHVIVVDLPLPPSVNRIWQHNKAGRKRVSRSPSYVAWLREADQVSIATGQLRGTRMIRGPFTAELLFRRNAGDLDNRHKGVFDWAQSREVILNDKLAEDIRLRWGSSETAPLGCRLTLTEISS